MGHPQDIDQRAARGTERALPVVPPGEPPADAGARRRERRLCPKRMLDLETGRGEGRAQPDPERLGLAVAMGIIPFFTRLAGRAQSGYVFTYAFAMVIGIVVILTWVVLTGGAN